MKVYSMSDPLSVKLFSPPSLPLISLNIDYKRTGAREEEGGVGGNEKSHFLT